ncbi:(S)-benzoin forming benzil reductase [Priestia filamentosa]|uniref:(S)-benzoin forming benzil reductase n=1 Tax=Priestia filamentosa TaxID=1402861 RepID=UPI003981B36F
MKYYIITGTSSGIGESLVKELLAKEEQNHIISIARRENTALSEIAKTYNKNFSSYKLDLRETKSIEGTIQAIFNNDVDDNIESIYLINNAGVLSPIGPIERNPDNEIIDNIAINLISPMVLTSHFIKHTNYLEIDKRILNISSGSAKYLLPSQSAYSTSKAGLDSFTKSIVLEQKEKEYPVRIVSVYPGVISTKLQEEIRAANKEDFPLVHLFQEAYENGQLQTSEDTAKNLLELLLGDTFGQQTVVEELTSTRTS